MENHFIQAQCGSCAAFSVIGAVESCFNIQRGKVVDDLSEQHILDCAYNYQVSDERYSCFSYQHGCTWICWIGIISPHTLKVDACIHFLGQILGQCVGFQRLSFAWLLDLVYTHNSSLKVNAIQNNNINYDSGTWGAYGCDGAWPNAYVDWLMGKYYNQIESAYPYTSGSSGQVGSCK